MKTLIPHPFILPHSKGAVLFLHLFILLPLYTEWILDRKGMSAEELGKYLSFFMDEECVIKFPFES